MRVRAVPALIAANAAVFLCQSLLRPAAQDALVDGYGLSHAGIEQGRWWQFLTHAFLHGNVLHLLVNMAGLWFAGRIVERVMGTWRFLALYASSAVAGGLFQIVVGGPGSVLLGASGAVFGVIIAFTTMFPEARIGVLLFFVLPLHLKAKYLAWGLLASTIAFLAMGFEPWIGHAAHLGGCIAGYLFTRLAGFVPPFHAHPRPPP